MTMRVFSAAAVRVCAFRIVLSVLLLCSVTARPAAAQPASLSLADRAYARVAGSAQFAHQQFTVATWFRPSGPGEMGGGTLVSCGEREGSTGNFLCSWWTGWQASTGRVLGMVVHEYAVSGRVVTSHAVVPVGQLAHAALTFDGVTLRLYINGVLDQSEVYGFSGVTYDVAPEVYVGAFLPDSGYTFNRFDGQIDNAGVWNRPLSAAEVAVLASCEPMLIGPGLVAYYPFTHQLLSDSSGNGHHATAFGPVAFGAQAAAAAGGAIGCCPADFNTDGFVNSADFFDFLTAFFNIAPAADVNHDGSVNSQDFFDFLAAFFAGC